MKKVALIVVLLVFCVLAGAALFWSREQNSRGEGAPVAGAPSVSEETERASAEEDESADELPIVTPAGEIEMVPHQEEPDDEPEQPEEQPTKPDEPPQQPDEQPENGVIELPFVPAE